MDGFVSFVGDPKVHDTVLVTMVISSFLAAIRRFKIVNRWWQVLWNFFYDWATGFWSLKTGQPVTQHIQTSEQTPGSSKIEDSTFTSGPDPAKDQNPIPPVAIPAPTK